MKPRSLRQRDVAVSDVRQAAVWFRGQGGARLAREFIAAVEAAYVLVAQFPEAGSKRHAAVFPELAGGLRFVRLTQFPDYLVYYHPTATEVEVLRIWNATRGLQALVDPTDPLPDNQQTP